MDQPDNDSLLDWALYYASEGLKVFPLEHKLPLPGTNGFLDGTSSPKLIREWWSRENWNIGAVIPKGVVILDTDGAEAEQAMKAWGWDTPATLTSRSRRGHHRWYRADVQIARKIEIIKHVDLLTNGYVVLPPSKHIEGQYRWVGNFSKDSISDAPDWLLAYEKSEIRVDAGLDGDKLLKGIPEGERQVTLFRMACKYRGQGVLGKDEAITLIDKMCRASNFKDQTAEYIVDRVWKNYAANESAVNTSKGKVWNLAVLTKSNIDRPNDFISNLVPQGVTLLTGDPKAGKSFLAAQVAHSIATGSSLFGRQVKQEGGVFYIDAEQGEGFAVDRWNTQTGGEIPPNIDIAFSWRRMDQGGMKDLEDYLSVSPHIRMVVIDTLSQFWPVSSMSSSGNAYHQEAVIIAKIAEIYKNWGVSLLLVHHNAKGTQSSMIKKAGGTMALTGGVHGYLSLSEADLPKLKFDGILEITGKNVQSGPIEITFDNEQLKWARRK